MQDYDIKDIFNLPVKVQMMVVGLFCVLMFYLGYQFDIAGLKHELLSAQTEEKNLKMQFEALESDLGDLNRELAQLPQLTNLLKKWNDQLVQTTNLPDMLNDILKLGTENQLEFQLFNPGAETKEDAYPVYDKVPINVVTIGDYHETANFMSQIANLPKLVVIDNFIMSRGQNKLFDKKAAAQPGYANRMTTLLIFQIYHLSDKPPSKALIKEPGK
jgi:type IV pilus assembly protein PilO